MTDSLYPNVKCIILENFMNHTASCLYLKERGLNVLFGPNGTGKSAFQEGLAFLESDAHLSRFRNFKDPFNGKEMGYVEVQIEVSADKVRSFKRSFAKDAYRYYYNGKRVQAAEFITRLDDTKIRFGASNIISQGEIASKFNKNTKQPLREMIERITGDYVHVEKYQELVMANNQTKTLLSETSTGLGDLQTALKKFEEQVEVLDRHNEISKEIGRIQGLAAASRLLRAIRNKSDIEKKLVNCRRGISHIEKRINKAVEYLEEQNRSYKDLEAKNKKLMELAQDTRVQIQATKQLLSVLERDMRPIIAKRAEMGGLALLIELFNRTLVLLKEQAANVRTLLQQMQQDPAIVELNNRVQALEKARRDKDSCKSLIDSLNSTIKKIDGLAFDATEYKKLEDLQLELKAEKESALSRKEEIEDDLEALKKNQVKKPKYLKDFEAYAEKHDIAIKGPACFVLSIKEDVEDKKLVKEMILGVADRNMDSYLVQTLADNRKAHEYAKARPPSERVNVIFIPEDEPDRVTKLPPGGIDFLANYISAEAGLEKFIWSVIGGPVVVVSDTDTGAIIAEKYRTMTVSKEHSISRPLYYGCKTYPIPKKTNFDNLFGTGDPELLSTMKDELSTELRGINDKMASLIRRSAEVNEELASLNKIKEEIENRNTYATELEAKLAELAALESTIIHGEAAEKELQAFKKTVKHLMEMDAHYGQVDLIEKTINNIELLKEYSDQIASLETKLKENDESGVVEALAKYSDIIVANEESSTLMRQHLSRRKKQADCLAAKLVEASATISRLAVAVPKGLDVEEIGVQDETELERQSNKLRAELPPLTHVDPDAREKHRLLAKNVKQIEQKYETLEKKHGKLLKDIDAVKARWAKEFLEKVKKIETDTNSLIKFLGLDITLDVLPLNIENAELVLKVKNDRGQLDASSLSGGQKSLLNLAIFLGANFFSENIFFLLDEMDQNMDPASTMMGKQILDKFSQEKQVLLLTPGKDPAMLQDANLIMIDERDDGVSLKHLTNVEMQEMEAKADT